MAGLRFPTTGPKGLGAEPSPSQVCRGRGRRCRAGVESPEPSGLTQEVSSGLLSLHVPRFPAVEAASGRAGSPLFAPELPEPTPSVTAGRAELQGLGPPADSSLSPETGSCHLPGRLSAFSRRGLPPHNSSAEALPPTPACLGMGAREGRKVPQGPKGGPHLVPEEEEVPAALPLRAPSTGHMGTQRQGGRGKARKRGVTRDQP